MTAEGRRRDRPRRIGWAFAGLAAAQLALAGWFATAGTVVLLAVGELLLATAAALVLSYGRYLSYRRSYELGLARRAREQERTGLAEELHDVLGHELSLIALRAAALQVTSTGAASEQAAAVRGQVEQAVLQLRQIVALLRPAGDAARLAGPSGWDLGALVERTRGAGATIEVEGGPGDVPTPVGLTAYRVVQECLTNAAKHSPGAPVGVRLEPGIDALLVTVSTAGTAEEDPATWSGLARLRRRVVALDGELTVRGVDGTRVTCARIPFAGARSDTITDTAPDAVAPGPGPGRRPGAATVRSLLPPAVAVGAAVLAFHAWATLGADLEPDRFAALASGQPASAARPELPAREAPVHLIPTPPAPPSWRCRYFTDGNFPLGMATFEVCDDGEVLTRVHDLRRQPWR